MEKLTELLAQTRIWQCLSSTSALPYEKYAVPVLVCMLLILFVVNFILSSRWVLDETNNGLDAKQNEKWHLLNACLILCIVAAELLLLQMLCFSDGYDQLVACLCLFLAVGMAVLVIGEERERLGTGWILESDGDDGSGFWPRKKVLLAKAINVHENYAYVLLVLLCIVILVLLWRYRGERWLYYKRWGGYGSRGAVNPFIAMLEILVISCFLIYYKVDKWCFERRNRKRAKRLRRKLTEQEQQAVEQALAQLEAKKQE